MTDTLALEALYLAVRARFTSEGYAVDQAFGWREPPAQTARPRIAWFPGDPGGDVGTWAGARSPGRNPRPLATLRELFTVEIFASDPLHLENELAQYKAARLLADAWFRAVYLAARGTFQVRSTRWLNRRGAARTAGATLQLVCEVEAMVPDVEHPIAPVDTQADVATSVLEETEHDVIPETA